MTAKATARYSALCDDFDENVKQNGFETTDIGLPLPVFASTMVLQVTI